MIKGDMRGFTLLEALIVMCILVIITGFASMGTELVRGARVSGVAHELLADIQTARIRAMTQNARGFGIRFQSTTSYVLFKFEDCNDSNAYDINTCANGSREENEATVKNIPPSVTFKKTAPTTDFIFNDSNNILIFDSSGVPRGPKWGLGNMTIIVKNASGENVIHCIAISTTRVRGGVWGWNRKAGKYACL